MPITVIAPQKLGATSTVLTLNELTNVPEKAFYDGIQFSSFGCAVPCVEDLDPCLPTGFPATPVGNTSYTNIPFNLKQYYKCGTVGLDFEEFKANAIEHFNAGISKSIANGLWRGPGLTKGLTNVPAGGQLLNANGVATGIALLSQAIASSGAGSQGQIHCTVMSATAAVHRGVVYRAGRELRTVVGDHLVIADGGYTGSAPGDAVPAAGFEWMYATGPVGLVIDDLKVYDVVERRANNYEINIETSAIAFWDECCWFGVPVNLSCDLGCGV